MPKRKYRFVFVHTIVETWNFSVVYWMFVGEFLYAGQISIFLDLITGKERILRLRYMFLLNLFS